jgi:hypothetical protein
MITLTGNRAMLRLVLTGLVFVLGLFDLFIGLGFLLDPVRSGASLGLQAIGVQGLSSLRGDFTSYFCVSAFCMMWGAWYRNGDLLLVPAALVGVVLAVRCYSLAVDGIYPGWQLPMAVEALHVLLLVWAWRVLPRRRVEEITG